MFFVFFEFIEQISTKFVRRADSGIIIIRQADRIFSSSFVILFVLHTFTPDVGQ